MSVEFKAVDLEKYLTFCFAARKDAYYCSFGTYADFDDFIAGYRERILEGQSLDGWFYIHVWLDGKLVGQLEFRSFSSEPDTVMFICFTCYQKLEVLV